MMWLLKRIKNLVLSIWIEYNKRFIQKMSDGPEMIMWVKKNKSRKKNRQ